MLTALLDGSSLTRVELSRLTRLSKPTVNAIIDRFCDDKVVSRTTVASAPPKFSLDARAGSALAISISASRVRVGLASLSPRVDDDFVQRPTPDNPTALLDLLSDLSGQVSRRLTRARPSVVAIAVPGIPVDGKVQLATNTPALDQVDFAARAHELFECEVLLVNDANCATLAEGFSGAARGRSTYVGHHFGVGIGMGLVVNGELFEGPTGRAGETGFMPAERLGSRIEASDFRAIAEEFKRHGDHVAQTHVEQAAHVVARVVMAVQSVIDPEIHVLGGTVGASSRVIDRVRSLLDDQPLRALVAAGELGGSAALIGAQRIAIDHLTARLLERHGTA